ncbi:hypothetical protein WG936_05395 [Corynebacterium sp. H127]|uniref:hypothetical protein n=1 Tax=Corynebacterium sp. H127 TaxID=3133418 RepID=UPI00309C5201
MAWRRSKQRSKAALRLHNGMRAVSVGVWAMGEQAKEVATTMQDVAAIFRESEDALKEADNG